MNAESVKARLKNIAVKDGGTMQDKLITYALERSIYRLSVSKYVDRFTLKGGLDFVETKVIADRAYRWFILGDYSIKGEENDVLADE